MTFTKNMERIQEIVQMLDSGNLTLEESVELFKEGVELVKNCRTFLENTEQTIRILSEELEKDVFTTTPETEEADDER